MSSWAYPLVRGMTDAQIRVLSIIRDRVSDRLRSAESGHDWLHVDRVLRNATEILNNESKLGADPYVVLLTALLHDVADAKFNGGDERMGALITQEWLNELSVDPSTIGRVADIISNMSYRHESTRTLDNVELRIIQDADRLDAIGAVGVARTFAYGAYKNNRFYDVNSPPRDNISKAEYIKGDSTTINHFYEKLLKLKDGMHTQTARSMAAERHRFLELYLEQFYKEAGFSF
jgi:uncharacterized protein